MINFDDTIKEKELLTPPLEEVKNDSPIPLPEIKVEELPPEPDECALCLENVKKQLNNLANLFDERIRYDEYKNNLFDNMHKELTDYRNEAHEKNIVSISLDIIQLMDAYTKIIRKFEEAEPTEENYKRLTSNFYGILEDLNDVLYRQSIESYQSQDNLVDVKKQKIISNVETDDITLDNTIAERIAPGYEKNGKIIRPEKIAIYKYKKGE